MPADRRVVVVHAGSKLVKRLPRIDAVEAGLEDEQAVCGVCGGNCVSTGSNGGLELQR